MAARFPDDTEEYYETMARKYSRSGRTFLEIPEITFDDDSDNDTFTIVPSRRGSVISLSRFRSCPDLAKPDSDPELEPEVSDIAVTDIEKHPAPISPVVRSCSPLIRRRLHIDDNVELLSETPTPPSTPKTLRSFLSHKTRDSTRMLQRERCHESTLSRTSSAESGGMHEDTSVPLSEHNIHTLEKACIFPQQFTKFSRSMDQDEENKICYCFDSEGYKSKNDFTDPEDAQGKCERWLRSLNICKSDRLKSQSHIQLPPI